MIQRLYLGLLLSVALPFSVQPVAAQSPASAQERPAPADPLTVEIQLADADRFVKLFEATDGKPSAQELQEHYINPGSYGLSVFTPGRIGDGKRLAKAIAANPQMYKSAIDICLPVVKAANAELRSIYLGMQGALPEAKLPPIYVLFGAGNSGGTAARGVQVLGLETLCKVSDGPEELQRTLRRFFAHETVHVLQQDAGLTFGKDALLHNILAEGAADFIARLVTGEEPEPARSAWAEPREAELWEQFLADIDLTRAVAEYSGGDTPEGAAFQRWIGNYGNAPDGWPGELGYWMGMKIWERYYAAAPDKHATLREMLSIKSPRKILETGSLSAR